MSAEEVGFRSLRSPEAEREKNLAQSELDSIAHAESVGHAQTLGLSAITHALLAIAHTLDRQG